ncbi:type II toxin-antitoxin system RatA family toxin [Fodinicola acaciae]|uniref:type II toxin-antitoxin system RatA family toxin n=1 Tax=Fodinicola acaciae TaxID=2681555 RepID=UPI0013D376DF|nr:SRPBCC family protein [Fodinicola acaciae]
MPVVEVRLRLEVSPAAAWDAVCDVESYPAYMENVRSVKITDDTKRSNRISAWSVFLKGSILEWTESDQIDDERRRIDFQQVDGDLEHFAGYWQVIEADGPDSCEVVLYVDFEIGIPLLADMLNPVAKTALEDNSTKMLRGLEQRASAV